MMMMANTHTMNNEPVELILFADDFFYRQTDDEQLIIKKNLQLKIWRHSWSIILTTIILWWMTEGQLYQRLVKVNSKLLVQLILGVGFTNKLDLTDHDARWLVFVWQGIPALHSLFHRLWCDSSNDDITTSYQSSHVFKTPGLCNLT